MSHPLLKSLISEMVESYLEESYEDDLIESIFEEVSDETWEAIEEAILNELSPKTLASYTKKAARSADSNFNRAGIALAKAQDAGERAHKSDTDRGYDYHKDREAKQDQKFREYDSIHRKRVTGMELANKKLGK
jgi:hypothetical protein